MAFLTDVRLMFTVARRELTSILRGKAERLLFIWTSLLLLPLVTIGIITIFLLLRTTDILNPVRLAVSVQQTKIPVVAALLNSVRTFPEIVLLTVADPAAMLDRGQCDATIQQDDAGSFSVTSRDTQVELTLSRVLQGAKSHTLGKLLHRPAFDTTFPYHVSTQNIEQYKFESEILRQSVIALYLMAYMYSIIWLIPAIDVVRFDYLQNNIYANLCLPVPMRVVTGGKLLSGIVITLLPTILSGLAFIFSMLVVIVVAFDYYTGGIAGGAVTFSDFQLPVFKAPLLELALLPVIVVLAVAFLHAWLMMIIIFLQGQRLSFTFSILTLFAWAQSSVVFGAISPTRDLWPDAIPFFGLAALVHQLIDHNFSWAGLLLALSSTLLGISCLVMLAGSFYRLEPWSSRMRSRRARRRLEVAK